MDAMMLNDSDTVGSAFKRAFYRVDGITMYACWAIWVGGLIWDLLGSEGSGIHTVVLILIGLLNPFLFLLLGLWRLPGLLTALIIIGINIKFLFAWL
ncbi:hypothetical protein ALQ54_02733 [Pseudomonas syringae]|uniref:Uncharacterized protein n=3 Tax=Pseudomonas TaxID=286 RepID=A0A3M4XPJ3_9PSED|nr:hypothetical protein CCL10_24125 [Pseudomonas syringae]RMN63812.1 hypothetical protein ALQ54_02733 [Pseudomonas syringae]RMR78361.1 hypothetical protein ALP78_00900 [Pseudomonas coronafaciens pv. striafaciens]